jgi:alanyl-tRNA synthetase
MKTVTSLEVREKFLSFFVKKDHLLLKNSSLLPKDDPTLLFINSGMAPLKPYFLGLAKPASPRLCNVQGCIRTIDIDDVGDRHHLTFFEMLGSWSIGDYYKEKAVELAYELLVDVFGFDSKKLYVTVYKGNPNLNIPSDYETAKAWEKIGIKSSHIVYLGDEDNFWGPAGNFGPCGPCTEVFYDTGDQFGEKYASGKNFDTKNRYIEIWNAGVFIEYNKTKDLKFEPLKLKSVDTGSGLERMTFILNGYDSVYEIDALRVIMQLIKELKTAQNLTTSELRILADHLRASTFIISEGVLPSNEGQGYIPRRLIRKCISLLIKSGETNIDFSNIIDEIIKTREMHYPLLTQNKKHILYQLNKEVSEFIPLITRSFEILDENCDKKTNTLTGEKCFDLVSTYGVPIDIIKEYLKTKAIHFDAKGYCEQVEKHKIISRSNITESEKHGMNINEGGDSILTGFDKTNFIGYDSSTIDSEVIGILKDNKSCNSISQSDTATIITKDTCFYAESGGQVSDTGFIKSNDDNTIIRVINTIKAGNVFLHISNVEKGKLSISDKVVLSIDLARRQKIQNNHSATHLLHAALHKIVGEHAIQKGSYVNPDRLRFDFVHNQELSFEELEKIETLVNKKIWENIKSKINIYDLDTAIKKGATALFNENYGELVRMVEFNDYSKELCGGCHVKSTGEIGLFYIVSESSIAKGVRRIEAITGEEALQKILSQKSIIKNTVKLLAAKENEIVDRIQKLKDELLEKSKLKIETKDEVKFEFKRELSIKSTILNKDILFFVAHTNNNAEKAIELGWQMIDSKKADIVFFIISEPEKIKTVMWLAKDISQQIHASKLFDPILKVINGKGGGKAHFVMGGSAEVDKLPLLLDQIEPIIRSCLIK